MKRFVEFYGTDDPQGYGYEVVSVDGDNVTARALPEGAANFVFALSEFTSGYLVAPCSCGSTRLRRTVDSTTQTNETYCEECGDVQV